MEQRIDVHAHYITKTYREAAVAAGHSQPDGMPVIPDWDAETALALMDRLNIRKAMLSISSPGVHFGENDEARRLARSVNEEGSRIVANNPERFGLFISLPLPDFEGALDELAFGLDELKANGIVLETNCHGIYLGDERLDGLFMELDRRKAVVFIHPTSPNCNCGLDLGYPRPMLEFMFETTRSVTNLLLRKVHLRFPNVRIIVPHAGAALPVLADRVAAFSSIANLEGTATSTDFFAGLQSLYYDLAGMPLPRLLPALLTIANPKHILYGSDYPFTPAAVVEGLAKQIDEGGLSAEQLKLFMIENARRLFNE